MVDRILTMITTALLTVAVLAGIAWAQSSATWGGEGSVTSAMILDETIIAADMSDDVGFEHHDAATGTTTTMLTNTVHLALN